MNLMGSSIQLLLFEKHTGRACGYIKKLQNKNSHNFPQNSHKKKTNKKKYTTVNNFAITSFKLKRGIAE